MKKAHVVKGLVLIVSMITLLSFGTRAQSTKVDQAVKDKRFTIIVQSMSPRRGGYKQLTSLYTFIVTPDTIVTDLPYAGRAYQAPMGSDNAGINFLSREFEYEAKPGKKGAWEITLRPKDVKNYPQVNVTLQASGSASIRMSPVDRDYISYTGTLKE